MIAHAGEADLYYEDSGAGSPTLVLVNGVGDPLEGWANQTADFLAAGLRVVSFDNRGVGRSSTPPGPYTSAQMAADLHAVVCAAGLNGFHLAGVSMGGVIAQEYALAHPADLRSLVLANTFAAADPARRAQRWADLRENLAELAAYAHQCGLDHLLVENLVTDREPSTMALIENILAERSVAQAPVQLCLDLGHPFVCGGSPADRDPYAWLEHFGPRIAEVQLQQSDGLADHHWPFTPERNATGLVDPARVLDTLAGAGVTDVLLILEVIPAFEADDREVISDLRASAEVWRRALADRAVAGRGLS